MGQDSSCKQSAVRNVRTVSGISPKYDDQVISVESAFR